LPKQLSLFQIREFENQSKEMLLSCSIWNRFTHLGMPNSYRIN